MAKPTISVSRDMPASAERVFALVTDLPKMGELSPENAGGEWLAGATGPAVGAKFKGTNGKGQKTWTTEATVAEFRPHEAFAFEVNVGPVKVARWSYAIEPKGDGCTVTETWTERRPKLLQVLFGKTVSGVADRASFNKASMETTLQRVAEKLA
jgi:Polyketide cyclase / dehydrase and lipid transport